MSDRSYWMLRAVCLPPLLMSSRRTVLHRERAARTGGFILALNHNSYFDVPSLFVVSPRCLDFQSVELFEKNFLVRFIFGCMNTFYVDRAKKKDVRIAKLMVDRLKAGRIVALFPERSIRRGDESVLVRGQIKAGTARLAMLAGVPIIPAAVVGPHAYHKVRGWLPFKQTQYGVAFGEAIHVDASDPDDKRACDEAERKMVESLQSLYEELRRAAPGVELR